jgi:conjugative relaxase-like TrwC/TraI family protein
MLTISPMGVGQASYYAKFARGNYYAKEASGDGKWLGTGAAALGLAGPVDGGDLKRLFEGFHPNGKELVQNAGAPDRQAGLDLTFSAEKTVSILSEIAAQVDRAEIEQAHHTAVETALEYLQNTSIWTRRGKAGVKLEPTSLVAAAFTHHTSRNLDPNLHTHVLLLNVGVRADGTTGTVRTSDLFHHKMVAGAIYRAQLAYELTHRLGFEIETGERGLFRIHGVPDEVRDVFSSRRKEIEQAVDPAFHAHAKTMAKATLATRPAKRHEDLDTLRDAWRTKLNELGWSLDNVPRRAQRLESIQKRQKHLDQLIAAGLTETPSLSFEQDQHSLVDQKPAFAERDLVRYLAEQVTDGAFTAHDVIGAVKNELARQAGPIRLGQDNPYDIWATHPTLNNERAVIDDVAELSRTRWSGIGLRHQKKMLRDAHAKGITDDAVAAMATLTSPARRSAYSRGERVRGRQRCSTM